MSQPQKTPSVKVEVDPTDIKTIKTDDRGRAYIDPKLKEKQLSIAILDVKDLEEADE